MIRITLNHPIDAEHGRLYDLIDKCIMDSKNNTKSVLKELYEYSVYHFNSEEKLMEGYPFRDEHISKHKQFQNLITEKLGKEKDPGDVAWFIEFWIKTHIDTHDRKFVKWINETKKSIGSVGNSSPQQTRNI